MASTQNYKGSYIPALQNAAQVNPSLEPGIGFDYALGYLSYLGILIYGNAHIRVWAPFLNEGFYKSVEPSTITVKNADNEIIEGACQTAGVTNEGIKFRLNASLIQGLAGGRIKIQVTPDDSWPILDKRWAPRNGAAEFPFPAAWVTG